MQHLEHLLTAVTLFAAWRRSVGRCGSRGYPAPCSTRSSTRWTWSGCTCKCGITTLLATNPTTWSNQWRPASLHEERLAVPTRNSPGTEPLQHLCRDDELKTVHFYLICLVLSVAEVNTWWWLKHSQTYFLHDRERLNRAWDPFIPWGIWMGLSRVHVSLCVWVTKSGSWGKFELPSQFMISWIDLTFLRTSLLLCGLGIGAF